MGYGCHSMVLSTNGYIYGSGNNYYGGLGITTTVDTSTGVRVFTQIPSPDNVRQVSTGYYHTAMLTNDGYVYTVGYNNQYQLGTSLNAGLDKSNTTPTLVPGIYDAKQVSCGYHSTAILLNNGKIYATGELNVPGSAQYELNPYLYELTVGTPKFKQIACGRSHIIGLGLDGYAYGAGQNPYGQCGTTDGLVSTGIRFTKITASGVGVIQVACSQDSSAFLTREGRLYTCGNNMYGQLGYSTNAGTNTATPTPTQVVLPGLVSQVACGQFFTAALVDGVVYTWGKNTLGSLGRSTNYGTSTATPTPGPIAGLPKIKYIAAGSEHLCMVTYDERAYLVGANNYGQLGNNSITSTYTPVLPLGSGVKYAWEYDIRPIVINIKNINPVRLYSTPVSTSNIEYSIDTIEYKDDTVLPFDASDASRFEPNNYVSFNGTLTPKNSYDIQMGLEVTTAGGKVWRAPLDTQNLTNITDVTLYTPTEGLSYLYLVKDGNDIKNCDTGVWQTVGSYPSDLNDTLFGTSTTALADITSSNMSGLISPELLLWTTDAREVNILRVTASPKLQIVKELEGHSCLNTITSLVSTGNAGMLISGNTGSTWYGILNSELALVDTSSATDVLAKMITAGTVGALTPTMLATVAPQEAYFAFVLNQGSPTDMVNVDSLTVRRSPKVQCKLLINGVDKTGYDDVHDVGTYTRIVNYEDLQNGVNTVLIKAITEDGELAFAPCLVTREAPHRLTVDRGFTTLDGGYYKENVTCDGYASTTSTGLLRTTQSTCVDLHGYSGIEAIAVTGSGGRYALSFNGGNTWESHRVLGYTNTSDLVVPEMTSNSKNGITITSSGMGFSKTEYNATIPGGFDGIVFKTATTTWLQYDFISPITICGYIFATGVASSSIYKNGYTMAVYTGSEWVTVHPDSPELGSTSTITRMLDTPLTITKARVSFVRYGANLAASGGNYNGSLIGFINLYKAIPYYGWGETDLTRLPVEGMQPTYINSLALTDYAEIFKHTQLDIAAHITSGDSINSVSVTLPDYKAPTIADDSITPDHVHDQDVVLSATITDADLDPLSYSISVNDVVVVSQTEYADGPLYISYTVPKSKFILGTNTVHLYVSDGVKSAYKDYTVEFVDTPPVVTVTKHDYQGFTAAIGDPDNDDITYKLELVDILTGDTTILIPESTSPSPVAVSTDAPTTVYKRQYTYKLTYRDSLGLGGSVEYNFEGMVSALAFYDAESDRYWSDGNGNAYMALDLGQFDTGSKSIIRSVTLQNTTGKALSNVTISSEGLPAGTRVKFSRLSDVSDGLETLVYGANMNDGDSTLLYLQVEADDTALDSGTFKIKATGTIIS